MGRSASNPLRWLGPPQLHLLLLCTSRCMCFLAILNYWTFCRKGLEWFRDWALNLSNRMWLGLSHCVAKNPSTGVWELMEIWGIETGWNFLLQKLVFEPCRAGEISAEKIFLSIDWFWGSLAPGFQRVGGVGWRSLSQYFKPSKQRPCFNPPFFHV